MFFISLILYFRILNKRKEIFGGVLVLTENKEWYLSVCVAQIYIKSWKKINANSENFGANDLALAA